MSYENHTTDAIEEELQIILRLRDIEDELAMLDREEAQYRHAAERQLRQEARRRELGSRVSHPYPDTSKPHQEWQDVFHNLGPRPDRDPDCPICHCEISADEETLRHAGCDRCFHSDCLTSWADSLISSRRTPNCPLCRADFAIASTDAETPQSPLSPTLEATAWDISQTVRDRFYGVAVRMAEARATQIARYVHRYNADAPVDVEDWIEIEYERLAERFNFAVNYAFLAQRAIRRVRRRQQRRRYRPEEDSRPGHERTYSLQRGVLLRHEYAFYYDPTESERQPRRRHRR